MHAWDTVAIVGVGLIGGSIGLGLRERGLARRVVGVGRRRERLQVALDRGAITELSLELPAGVADAELVIVCTPVGQIAEHVRQVAESCAAGALVTDVGSTKRSIVESLDGRLPRGVQFVGSHPLAGSERTGPEAARIDLFVDRVVVVTPTALTPPASRAAVERLWTSLGARLFPMSPDDHDAALAATSHVPHVIASALAASTPAKWLPLTAGGWRDTTRIAAGDTDLWLQILLDNRTCVLESLARVRSTLADWVEALERHDEPALRQLWESGQRTRNEWRSAATKTDGE